MLTRCGIYLAAFVGSNEYGKILIIYLRFSPLENEPGGLARRRCARNSTCQRYPVGEDAPALKIILARADSHLQSFRRPFAIRLNPFSDCSCLGIQMQRHRFRHAYGFFPRGGPASLRAANRRSGRYPRPTCRNDARSRAQAHGRPDGRAAHRRAPPIRRESVGGTARQYPASPLDR